MVEEVRSISAMYHSTRPCGATRVSRRLLMVAVDQAPTLRLSAASQSPPLPERSLRGKRQGVLHSTSARVRRGYLWAKFSPRMPPKDSPTYTTSSIPRWSRMLTRSSTKVSREGSYWSSSMMDSPIPLMSGRRMRNSRDSNGTQLYQNLPLRENPGCNSIVGADRHGSVKSSS